MAAGKVNGKQKGNSFERKIANLLSDRFKEHTGIESSFRRNPDSGSFFGGSNHSRTEKYDTEFAIFGDLICPKSFAYSVECKHYKTAYISECYRWGSKTMGYLDCPSRTRCCKIK